MLRVFLKAIDGVHDAVALLNKISGRIYESYFMPSRMKVYRTLLESAVANSYHMLSVLDVLVVSTVITTAAEPGDYFRIDVEDEDSCCRRIIFSYVS